MLFVVDKSRFQKFISIVREDRKRSQQISVSPYLRIRADKDEVEVSSSDTSAFIKATVYEPGVLFIRTTLFRRVLRATVINEEFITFQVDKDALVFADVRMKFETNDMVLYMNPDEAPPTYPPPLEEQQTG
jgi:DNA polymerase III sliding clamp (beta) subunit (PCNA family)